MSAAPFITTEALREAVAVAEHYAAYYPWSPNPDVDGVIHPQRMAYESLADVIGYGGAAGGGKTDLACGKALTQHRKVMILRRVGTELTGIMDRFEELIGDGRKGFNGRDKIWKVLRPVLGQRAPRKVQIEFASLPNAGDEKGFQGRPHDLIVFDEAANFLEAQVRFLMGWNRTTVKGQRSQTLMTFNPPTSAEGRWIVDFFAPWLDPNYPNPAKPGELRWFCMLDGEEIEVEDGTPFDFENELTGDLERIEPKSRTFIPSRIKDNPHLMGTGYLATLQALPEPLRSQMLNGDFMAGVQDDAMQVIPTAWVELAMQRWRPRPVKPPMSALGVDVARGGADKTVIYRRHGAWIDEGLKYAGEETPNGPVVAGLVIAAKRDHAPIHIDVIGVGSSPYDFLREAGQQIIGVNVAEPSLGTDKSGRLRFFNLRSELIWRVREWLDPTNNTGAELPRDAKLKADLTAPRWELSASTIRVESRKETVKRLQRSPDDLSGLMLALIDTPKLYDVEGRAHKGGRAREYDPLANPA